MYHARIGLQRRGPLRRLFSREGSHRRRSPLALTETRGTPTVRGFSTCEAWGDTRSVAQIAWRRGENEATRKAWCDVFATSWAWSPRPSMAVGSVRVYHGLPSPQKAYRSSLSRSTDLCGRSAPIQRPAPSLVEDTFDLARSGIFAFTFPCIPAFFARSPSQWGI